MTVRDTSNTYVVDRWRRGTVPALTEEIAALYGGAGDGTRVVAVLREGVLVVPTEEPGALLTGDYRGVRWVFAFTSEAELARFARARGRGEVSWTYRLVFGWRLLDVALPALNQPAGLAVDVAGARPMMFPPVVGIVPPVIAVDAGRAG